MNSCIYSCSTSYSRSDLRALWRGNSFEVRQQMCSRGDPPRLPPTANELRRAAGAGPPGFDEAQVKAPAAGVEASWHPLSRSLTWNPLRLQSHVSTEGWHWSSRIQTSFTLNPVFITYWSQRGNETKKWMLSCNCSPARPARREMYPTLHSNSESEWSGDSDPNKLEQQLGKLENVQLKNLPRWCHWKQKHGEKRQRRE